MTFQVIHFLDGGNTRSPFRVIEQPMGREVEWINRFLDRECVRRLAENTLRSYAMDLLDFLRWWDSMNHTVVIREEALSATVLMEYLRFQTGEHPQPAAATINRRMGVVERALRNEFPDAASPFVPGFHHFYWRRSPLVCSRPRPTLSRLRVKEPKRIVIPLSVDEVARFWSSFRTSRDLAIVGLMLLQGLRSNEVITLNCEDVLLPESQIRVRGKGNKIRCLPLASDTVLLLDHYLRLERPQQCGSSLFVSLKGPARGVRMTPAGMRSLFRYHRCITETAPAHPHRFRHTFASDMVRAGISLPALMHLMGHAHISTTMLYAHISPRDVFEQYARAVAQHIRPALPIPL
jgi:site-specific recombinase XerD